MQEYFSDGVTDVVFGFSDDVHERALHAERRAVELDDEDPRGHLALGVVHYAARNHEAAIAELEMAIEQCPSHAYAHFLLATALSHSGRAEDAIAHVMTAIRLSPEDSNIGLFYGRMALANLHLKRHEEALEWSTRALRHPTMPWPSRACRVSALSHLGRDLEARQALEELRDHTPDITASFIRGRFPLTDIDYLNHMLDGLRKAGLPE